MTVLYSAYDSGSYSESYSVQIVQTNRIEDNTLSSGPKIWCHSRLSKIK